MQWLVATTAARTRSRIARTPWGLEWPWPKGRNRVLLPLVAHPSRTAAPQAQDCRLSPPNSGCQEERLGYSAARSGPETSGDNNAGFSVRATALTAAGMSGYLPVRRICGEVAEWSKAHAWKVCRRETVSRVRIPLSPPAPRGTQSGHSQVFDR